MVVEVQDTIWQPSYPLSLHRSRIASGDSFRNKMTQDVNRLTHEHGLY